MVVGLGPWREDLLVAFCLRELIESGGLGAVVAGVRVGFASAREGRLLPTVGISAFLRDYVEMRSVAGMNAACQIGFYEANHDLWIPCF